MGLPNNKNRIGLVRDIFSSIPKNYDLLNRVLSLRRDVYWRAKTVSMMRFSKTMRFLDVATGTGDLAIEASAQYPEIAVVGVDFVKEMIRIGNEKIAKLDLTETIRLIEGDALCLPFKDGFFDVSAVAFGIRNIPDKECALYEMTRVIVSGGQVMVLELTMPDVRRIRKAYEFYLRRLLPKAGRLVSKNSSAYQYLADSIMEFPSTQEFCKLMASCGLRNVKAYPLTFGTATLFIGEKR